MNEYVYEFNKIFNYLKEVMKDYCDNILSKCNINPFSDEAYKDIVSKLMNIKDDSEYLTIINQFILSIHEGHAYLVSKNDESNKIIPLVIQYVNGKYFVVKAIDQTLENKEVTKINDMGIDEYVLKNIESFSVDKDKIFVKDLIIPGEEDMTISFTDEEKTLVKPIDSQEFNSNIIARDNPYTNNILFNIRDGIPYLRINSFSHQMLTSSEKYNFLGKEITSVPKYLEAIADYLNNNNVNDLIIDIRGNKGGSDEWFSLLSMFSDKDYSCDFSVKSSVGRLSYGETNNIINGFGENIDESCERLQEGANDLDCSVSIGNGNSTIKNRYLLINSDNYSVCDTLSKLANKTGFATTIGVPTSGDGFGVTPYSFTTDILKRNNARIIIPSTFYRFDEFQTEPSIKIDESLLMQYEYGTYKDNQLNQVMEIIKLRNLEQESGVSLH